MNYKCAKCGDVRARQFFRACSTGGTCEYEVAEESSDAVAPWLLCPHRKEVVAMISGDRAGCGCGGSTVEVYRCDKFGEPVLKHAAKRCKDKIAQVAPSYTGRTCRGCELWT